MSPGEPSRELNAEEIADLRARLAEAEQTIEAVRSGAVDAVVVHGAAGPRVYTLAGADQAYRVALEGMSEGALTLAPDTVILFCNRRFAEMLGVPPPQIIGTPLLDYVLEPQHETLRALCEEALTARAYGLATLRTASGEDLPARLSASRVDTDDVPVIGLIVTDLTEQFRVEEELREHLRIEHENEQRLLEYQESLRSLASQLVLAEESERRRLADLLHDDVAQNLALAKLRLEILGRRLDEEGAVLQVQEIAEVLGQTIQSVRSLSLELSPAMLYRLGLGPALQWALGLLPEAGPVLELDMGDTEHWPLADDLRFVLFRSTRELVINAIKHAQARTVRVSLRQSGDLLELRVEDDGIGFDPAVLPQPGPEGGLGLFNIRERIADLGGQIEIDSARGTGARIRLTAPLEPPRP